MNPDELKQLQTTLEQLRSRLEGGNLNMPQSGSVTPTLKAPQKTPSFWDTEMFAGGVGANYLSSLRDQTQQTREDWQNLQEASRMAFDVQKAQTNFYYGNAIQDLQQNKDKALQMAKSNAIALNPYSRSRGASTAANFENAVNEKYTLAEARIAEQADLAMQALVAGEYQQAAQMQANMNRDIQALNNQVFSSMFDMFKVGQAQEQFETQFEQRQYETALNAERAAVDDFRGFMTQLSGDPQLQVDVDSYFSEGTISQGLLPLIETGRRAGYNPTESLSLFQYQTGAARRLEWQMQYQAEQLRLSEQRMLSAQMNQNQWQARISAANNVNQISTALIGQGYRPNTLEYAVGVALASGGSPAFPTQQDRDKYRSIQELVGKIDGFQTQLAALSQNSRFRNLVMQYEKNPAKVLDDDMQEFLARQTPIAYAVLRGVYGEGARMSDPDFINALRSIGSAAQSPQVRQNIMNSLLSDLKATSIIKLQTDASSALNVAGYVSPVEQLVNEIDKIITESKAEAETPTSGFKWGDQSIKLPF